MTFNEHEHPRGDAGRFTETHHAEAGVTLGAPAPARPELDDYVIPAPLEKQKFLDGTRIPEGATFEEAYEEFFRPLDEHEAAHGTWEKTRPPSEEQLRDLAGLTGVNLGRTTGVFIEEDEVTGDPVIAVATTNGNSMSRDCISDSDFDCMKCKHCIQEHLVPALPTHIRDEDDEDGDDACVTSYFRPTDPAAAARYLTDQKTREVLNHRTWARDAITSGKQPPWAILTPVRDNKERHQLDYAARKARGAANLNANEQRYAMLLLKAVDSGSPLPEDRGHTGALLDSAGYRIYGEAVGKHQAEATRLRQEAAVLEEERKHPLPPAISALAAAEAERVAAAAAHEDEQVQKSRAQLEKSKGSVRHWADRRLHHHAELVAAVKTAEDGMAGFDWSSSWPGDPADCPPKPAAD